MKKFTLAAVFLVLAGFMVFNIVLTNDSQPNIAVEERVAPAQDEALVIEKPLIATLPEKVIQGEPAIILIEGLITSTVESLTFNGKRLRTFLYDGKPAAVVGIDLKDKTGSYSIRATLNNGRVIDGTLQVGERVIAKNPFDIPENLGGNTPEAERELNRTLAQENATLNAIPYSLDKLWNGNFAQPLSGSLTVTDPYGYSRLTGGSIFNHKGVDLRAPLGTNVYAVNDGIVRYTGTMRNYGNVIAVDHGTGILALYMHLDEIDVEEGQMVKKGQAIGQSGETGYAFGPHLHLTLRVNGVSVDPMKFLELFGSV